MKKLFYLVSALLITISLLTWIGCHKHDLVSFDSITVSVEGRVTDETGRPVNNATVSSGNFSATTNVDGKFRLDNILVKKTAAFISVTKSGYFKTGRTFLPEASAVNEIEVTLLSKTLKGNFSSSAPGTVTIQPGVTASYSANSFVIANNNSSYTGTVSFYGRYIDPTSQQLSSIMPGNLMAINSSNQSQLLRTFGMMAIEMEGSSGEKLQLAPGKTATISMAIPSSMLSNAPPTIPLWYFDETTGLWKEEGTATKQGNNYVGTVTHFSYWNCDIPGTFAVVTVTLQDQSGQPLPGYYIEFTDQQNNFTPAVITNLNGVAVSATPLNIPLVMRVYDRCHSLVYVHNEGPFSSNTNLGVITINSTATSVIISGTVTDCNSNNVTNGYVEITLDGSLHRVNISNGGFSATINRCTSNQATATIVAFDLQAGQQSAAKTISVTSGPFNAGVINACAAGIEFINYNMSGNFFYFLPSTDIMLCNWNQSASQSNIAGMGWAAPNIQKAISFSFQGPTTPGTFPIVYLQVVENNINYVQAGAGNVQVTEYGTVGQYIAGSFSGPVKDTASNGPILTVTSNFRCKRTQ